MIGIIPTLNTACPTDHARELFSDFIFATLNRDFDNKYKRLLVCSFIAVRITSMTHQLKRLKLTCCMSTNLLKICIAL